MMLLRRTTSLAGESGLYDCQSRDAIGRVFCVPGTLRDIAAPRRLEGLRFVVSTVREDLHSGRLPGDATSDPSTATPSR